MYHNTGHPQPPSIADRAPDERRSIVLELNRLFLAACFDSHGDPREPGTAAEEHRQLREFVWQNVRIEEINVRVKDKKTWLEIEPEPEAVIMVNRRGMARYRVDEGQHRTVCVRNVRKVYKAQRRRTK